MAVEAVDARRPRDVLTGARRRARYNPAEQRFSVALQGQLQEILQGRRDHVSLLRRYPRDPDRLGVPVALLDGERAALRLAVVDGLVWDALNFVRLKAAGGPVAQQALANGGVLETQTFPTKFPHIVIERADRYAADDDEPLEITWGLRRLQNQRTQTQLNRLLDAANLAFELLRVVR